MQRLLPPQPLIQLLEGGTAPENLTGAIRKFMPDWIWLFDAAEMGGKPGCIRLIDWQQVQGVSAFTHGLPPTLFARFLLQEFGSSIFLFGIQPELVEAFCDPTPTILQAVEYLSQELSTWLIKKYPLE